MATVSVYITTKDRPALLERAIRSVINQTFQDIEVLVIDDASACDNGSLVQSLQATTAIPLRYFRNERSMGACYSRNFAIRTAEGQYITGLDDDDEYIANRIELMVKHYRPEYAFVTSNDYLIRKNGQTTWTNRPGIITLTTLLDATENLVGNQILTEKSKLAAIGGFDPGFPAFQDFDTYYRLIKQFGAAYVLPDKLQNIYRNDNVVKISTYRNQFFGIVRFFLKHRDDMNRGQRKRFILRYRLMKAKLLGIQQSRVNAWSIFRHSGKEALKNNLFMYMAHYKQYLKNAGKPSQQA